MTIYFCLNLNFSFRCCLPCIQSTHYTLVPPTLYSVNSLYIGQQLNSAQMQIYIAIKYRDSSYITFLDIIPQEECMFLHSSTPWLACIQVELFQMDRQAYKLLHCTIAVNNSYIKNILKVYSIYIYAFIFIYNRVC